MQEQNANGTAALISLGNGLIQSKLAAPVEQPFHARQLWTETFQVTVLIEPYNITKPKDLNFQKCKKKALMFKAWKRILTEYMPKLLFPPRISGNFGTKVTCKCLALNFDVKFWSYA